MPSDPLTPRDRDATLQRLRDWRTNIALGSAGAAVAFAVVAAVTIPGKFSTASAAPPQDTQNTRNSTPQDPTQQSVPDNSGDNSGGSVDNGGGNVDDGGGSFQQPQQDPGQGYYGGGQVVSGGSR
jgi:hypothetical protein